MFGWGGKRENSGRPASNPNSKPPKPAARKKDNRGGARKGAGRPPGSKKRKYDPTNSDNFLRHRGDELSPKDFDDDNKSSTSDLNDINSIADDNPLFAMNQFENEYEEECFDLKDDSSEEEIGQESEDDDEEELIDDDFDIQNTKPGFLQREGEVPDGLRWVFDKLKNEDSSISKGIKSQGQTVYQPILPSTQIRILVEKGEVPSPWPYYLKTCHYFEPHKSHNHCKITCTNCKKSSTVSLGGTKNLIRAKGWTKNPRIVYGFEDIKFVFTRVYFCSACKVYLYSHNPDVFSYLPFEVQSTFPFVFSKRSGITVDLLYSMISDIENGTGVKGTANKLREAYMLKYQRYELNYYSTLLSLRHADQGVGSFLLSRENIFKLQKDEALKFSEFDDKLGYYGKLPSGNNYLILAQFLKSIFISESNRKLPYYQLEMQRRNGERLMVDFSYKLPKHIQNVGESPLIHGCFTAMNEYSEIRTVVLTQTSTYSELKPTLQSIQETSKLYGCDLQYVTTDQCCTDRGQLEEVFPSVRSNNTILELLPLPSPDKIKVLKSKCGLI